MSGVIFKPAQRKKDTYLQAVEEDLDHDESRSLEGNSGTLAQEAKHLEMEFSICGERTSDRDHLLVRLVQAEASPVEEGNIHRQ